MIDLYLVRHGETSYNLNKLIQGQKDIPLSIVGEKGAYELGAALKEKGISFDCYLSSPLKRAVETAQIIRFQLNQTDKSIKTIDEFKERSFGFLKELILIISLKYTITLHYKMLMVLKRMNHCLEESIQGIRI